LQTISNRSNRILRIGIVAPNGAQALDFMGPIDAFHEANRSSESASRYEVDLIGVRAGPIVSSSGTRLLPDKVIGSDLNLYDTILVAGSLDYQTNMCERGLVDWLATVAPLARRVGSISNGAFVLAAAGLLDGRRAATHWQAAKQLSAMFPKIRVEPDCLFVRDGPVYTAAGVTAGIDLCLHLIESDCGHATSLDVARMMVIFLRRSGGQPQISAFLKAQSASNTKIADAMEWALENLHADLSVDELAKRAASQFQPSLST
jgi:transcriptional regulator GlxA family with amidase domain